MTSHPFSDSKAFCPASQQGYLAGQLLIATPEMTDPRFSHAIILLCQHNEAGAMGIVLNKPLPNLEFHQLIPQLNLKPTSESPNPKIHFGGPVETSRGFILHSDEYKSQETQSIILGISMTATVDVLDSIVKNNGPEHAFLALGYAGWDATQLENELQKNSWLVTQSTPELLFHTDCDHRWQAAYESLGLNPSRFVGHTGQA